MLNKRNVLLDECESDSNHGTDGRNIHKTERSGEDASYFSNLSVFRPIKFGLLAGVDVANSTSLIVTKWA